MQQSMIDVGGKKIFGEYIASREVGQQHAALESQQHQAEVLVAQTQLSST